MKRFYPLLLIIAMTGCATSTTSGSYDTVNNTFSFETTEKVLLNAKLKKQKNMDFGIQTDTEGNITIYGKGNGSSESEASGITLDVNKLIDSAINRWGQSMGIQPVGITVP